MVEVYRTPILSQAQAARIALEAQGIEAVLHDELSPGYSGLAAEIRVFVPDEELGMRPRGARRI